MGTETWVVNASPLIFLGKARLCGLLPHMAQSVLVPEAVREEIAAGTGGAEILESLAQHEQIHFQRNRPVRLGLLAWDLGAGETQVIAAATLLPNSRVVLDDLQARRCARAAGLKIIGTLGLAGRAKRLGIIEAARPIVERLRGAGLYVTDALVEEVLREVGE